jgi:hypothetical protein
MVFGQLLLFIFQDKGQKKSVARPPYTAFTLNEAFKSFLNDISGYIKLAQG